MMSDITSVREMCRDYTESSDRVSKALHQLKHELRSLRQQDVTLLKQLVAINDAITGIKARHQQRALMPATLPRSGSLSLRGTPLTQSQNIRSMSFSRSLRPTYTDLQRPIQKLHVSTPTKDTPENILSENSLSSFELKLLAHNFSFTQLRMSHILRKDKLSSTDGQNFDKEKSGNGTNVQVHKCTAASLDSFRGANRDCGRNENSYVPSQAKSIKPTHINESTGDRQISDIDKINDRVQKGQVTKMMISREKFLPGSSTSIDTSRSQADSVYGSGSDLRVSCDSLNLSSCDSPVSSDLHSAPLLTLRH
ncbi:hypothetical protein Btru_019144 [Bulinus truncatus]|nr:hypothetical protein Btru_019144 [Bulinus truncatus]